MTSPAALPVVSPPGPGSPATVAAREACALCDTFDKLAHEAGISIDDPERLARLLSERDAVVALLDVHLAVIRTERSAAGKQRPQGDQTDGLVLQVRQSLESSLAATTTLLSRAAERAAELRQEIAAINRAESAQHAYVPSPTAVHLDSLR